MSYQSEDIEKMRKGFLGANPTEKDTWLHKRAGDFYRILEAFELREGNRVLYVGAGSGYATNVVSNLVGENGEIYSYEIDKRTMNNAKENIKKVSGINNINLIIADGLSQPHKKGYFDRIIAAAGGRLEIPEEEYQKIMKRDINKNGLLNHLVEQTRIGGIIVLPMGKLHQKWEKFECHGDVYKIKNHEDHLEISVIEQESPGFWTSLEGEYGFSEEEKIKAFSVGIDDNL